MNNCTYAEEGIAEKKYSGDKNKVLLIGDSIREGYCPFVKEYLAEQAEVVYPNDNCRNTHYVLTSLLSWATMFDDYSMVSVVTFNCGHWDIAHWNGERNSLTTKEDYGRNLKRIVERLRDFFPLAELVFFTTTPVSTSYKERMINPRSNEEIKEYNLIACKIMTELNVKVYDLFEVVSGYGEQCFKDYCHLTEKFNAKLGKYVADVVKTIIINNTKGGKNG